MAAARAGGGGGGAEAVTESQPRRFVFLLSSTRAAGNTEALARAAAAGLTCPADWLDLNRADLPAFADARPGPLPAPTGAEADLAAACLAASDLVLVAPVYWYGLPVPAKTLLDHWSNWLDVPALDFKRRMAGKTLWLITARADPDPGVPLPVEAMAERTARWMQMRWGGGLHGVADALGEMAADTAALTRARSFFG